MRTPEIRLFAACAAAALLCSLLPPTVHAQAAAAAASAPASAPQELLRPAIAAPVQAAVELLKARRFQEALAKVADAEQVPDRSAYENFVLDQLRGGAAAGAGDNATALRSFEAVVTSGRLAPSETLKIVEGLAGTSYRMKDYARAAKWARRYLHDGGQNPHVRQLLAGALYQQSDYSGAAQTLQALVGADIAAGSAPAEEALRLLAASQAKQGDDKGYRHTLDQLLRYHPSAAYWRERIQRLQRESGFDPLLLVDSYRLLFAVGAMQDAPEYTSLAELALQANLPAEARAVLDTGFAAGVLGAGPDAATHLALRQRVDKLAADDAKQLARAPDPGPDASADLRVATGLALATEGHTERGIALVEQGLAQGHLTQPAKVRLRLAWISAQAGRTDAARAILQSLQGRDDSLGEIARLWLIYLDGPADAAAPAASAASH